MALKYKQIPITMKEYSKKMGRILNDPNLEVHEKLIASIEEAGKYRIEETDCSKCIKKCKWERQSVWTCFDYQPRRKNDTKRKKKVGKKVA